MMRKKMFDKPNFIPPDRGVMTALGLLILISGLNIATNMFTLLYLGTSIDSDSVIDIKDWKRRWIVAFAWVRLVLLIVTIIMSAGTVFVIPFVNVYVTLSCLTSIFTLVYLGTSFEDAIEVDPTDWKRRWVIIFSWLGLVLSIGQFISLFIPYVVKNFYYNIYREPEKVLSYLKIKTV